MPPTLPPLTTSCFTRGPVGNFNLVARMEELASDDISGMLVFRTTVASFSALCWANSSSNGPVLLITFLLR